MIKIKKTALALPLEPILGVDFTPKRADSGAIGYDLRACIEEPVTLKTTEVFKFPTGVHIWIENGDPFTNDEYLQYSSIGYAGLYLPRSSNPGLILTNTIGLLDPSYQGESFLKYMNNSEEPITIKPGERIGQIIFVPAFIGALELVEKFESTTERGEGGFGSTGAI